MVIDRFAFCHSKLQVQQTNLQDQIEIQMDHDLEREQKVGQVLDTNTPEDKSGRTILDLNIIEYCSNSSKEQYPLLVLLFYFLYCKIEEMILLENWL